MSNQVIPAEAVEAATKAFRETRYMDDALMNALEAAAPHMLAGSWDQGHERGFWNGRMSQLTAPYDAPDPLIGKRDAEANNPHRATK